MPDSSSVYRELSEEMRDGLKNICRQISSASAESANPRPDALFAEASGQLCEVVKATEAAAMDIMAIVEKQLAKTDATGKAIAALRSKFGEQPELDELAANNDDHAQDLTAVLLALSFQDITGQRIKKVMAALDALQENVVELYLSSGLIMDAASKEPEKDANAIRAEAAKALEAYRENKAVKSELKGPDKSGASQAAIDDMLEQLGL